MSRPVPDNWEWALTNIKHFAPNIYDDARAYVDLRLDAIRQVEIEAAIRSTNDLPLDAAHERIRALGFRVPRSTLARSG